MSAPQPPPPSSVKPLLIWLGVIVLVGLLVALLVGGEWIRWFPSE